VLTMRALSVGHSHEGRAAAMIRRQLPRVSAADADLLSATINTMKRNLDRKMPPPTAISRSTSTSNQHFSTSQD
jgi:hypothetical protein